MFVVLHQYLTRPLLEQHSSLDTDLSTTPSPEEEKYEAADFALSSSSLSPSSSSSYCIEAMISGLIALHMASTTKTSNKKKQPRRDTTWRMTTREEESLSLSSHQGQLAEDEQNDFYDWSNHPILFQSLVEESREEKESAPVTTTTTTKTSTTIASTGCGAVALDTMRDCSSIDCSISNKKRFTTKDDNDNTSLVYAQQQQQQQQHVPAPTGQNMLGRVKKKVTFTTCEIREYNVTIGIHPICMDGLPLSLDWDYDAQRTKVIDLSSVVTSKDDVDTMDEVSGLARSKFPKFPKRLNFQERKDYLQVCTGMTEAELWLAEQEIWNSLPQSSCIHDDPCSLDEEMSCTSKVLHRASGLINFDTFFSLD